ncbi:MAG: hypothetical protein MUC99_02585 [Anaerolineae bacterium]|nr:hypothetical protein [Anaerolineae bacterium]
MSSAKKLPTKPTPQDRLRPTKPARLILRNDIENPSDAVVLDKLQAGLVAVENGQTYPAEEMLARLKAKFGYEKG